MSVAAQTLSPPSRTLMFLEGRAISELGAFLGALPLLSLAPRGDGHPVLVLPGLVASDTSTRPLRSFLKSRGYAVSGWRQGRNLGLRHGVQNAMVDLVQELNDTHGRKVSLVGWSLGGLYARQLAKMMPERVRSVITLGSPFAAGPKATNAWRVYEMASGRRADEEDHAFRRRAVGYAAGADHRDLQPHRRRLRLAGLHGARPARPPKASRSRAAIAAWVITPPRSMRWPIAWRRRKANGRRSIEAAGAAWFIRTRIGEPGLLLTSPRLRGEVGLRSDPGEGDSPRTHLYRICGSSPSSRPSPREERGEGEDSTIVATPKNALCLPACRRRLPASSSS